MKSFGRKSIEVAVKAAAPVARQPVAPSAGTTVTPFIASTPVSKERERIRAEVFLDLIGVLDLPETAKLPLEQSKIQAADVIRDLLLTRAAGLDLAEQDGIVKEIVNDILGYGPLEQFLARDDISDIMICGPNKIYIEIDGLLMLTGVKFRDEAQLRNVCSRIVQGVGRRVDESSPICDARLPDGSRVAIIIPPLALDGTCCTIRKFKKEKITLDSLVASGSMSEHVATILKVVARSRCNVLISGGTGSGKTTLLNCLTRHFDPLESVVTCEDAAELQLQQQNVRRWETRPRNLEGVGEVTMSDLVKTALRHRPDRIIIGEVRGPEAFDLLQAMNTGHDGSMGTVHSNSPREAVARLESMIAQGGFNLPARAVRDAIASSVDVIIQVTRLRDGQRKITHITEVVGMEGDIVTLQELVVFEHHGEDDKGKILGAQKTLGLRPHMYDRAHYYKLSKELMGAMNQGNI